jgi:hypothetical protein
VRRRSFAVSDSFAHFTPIYRVVAEEIRWGAVSPTSSWSIPLFHLKNRRTFTLFTSSDMDSATVDVVQPGYKPPCPNCGNRREEVVIQMQDVDGALEISHQGGSGTARIL